ncbi:hypothetical protein PVAND_003244 [Polypedilum vanderplanki]|uniref:Cuticle protein n=1 Tax=Polypedilum vanderplanki TaxID=319348 RepID=A0A9J6BTG3_POLVA|nr:hypothetical protein PVAND_003244 [Polypedilum vanderplanki]
MRLFNNSRFVAEQKNSVLKKQLKNITMKFLVILGAFVIAAAAFPHELSHGYKVEVKHDIHHPHHQIAHPIIDDYSHHHHSAPIHEHPADYYDHHHHEHEDFHAYPKYKFEYGVKDAHTGDHKSQWEIRDGDVVKGEYTLDEADGTKRIVSYEANDKTGFNAVVKKIGHAQHYPAQHHGHAY